MTQKSIDLSLALLLLINFPVYDSVQVLATRIRSYPSNAWGSWLIRGWAVALAATLIQFSVGTIVHSERLGSSFLAFCMPTALYIFVLWALIRKMFPQYPAVPAPSFLLSRFQENIKYIYASVFALAILPFVIGSSAFDDGIVSAPQLFRLTWMICAVIGFFSSATRLWIHKVLLGIGGPLALALLTLYSVRYAG